MKAPKAVNFAFDHLAVLELFERELEGKDIVMEMQHEGHKNETRGLGGIAVFRNGRKESLGVLLAKQGV